MAMDLDAFIGKVPDFPKAGIGFFDITKLLQTPDAYRFVIRSMVRRYRHAGLSAVAAIEARGFLFGAPLAERLHLPFIPVRKKGKLPGQVVSKPFSLEYGEDRIEIQAGVLPKGGQVLLVDDLIATGGTLQTALELIRQEGVRVDDIFCVIGLPFLGYEARFPSVRITTLIEYFSEDF